MKSSSKMRNLLNNSWLALFALIALIAFLALGVYRQYQLEYVHPELKWQVPQEAIEHSEKLLSENQQ